MKLCGAAYSRPIPAFSPNSGPIEIFKCRPFDTALRFEVFCGKPTYVRPFRVSVWGREVRLSCRDGGQGGGSLGGCRLRRSPRGHLSWGESSKNLCTFILILGGRHQSPFQLFPIVWREEARLPTGRWYRGGDEVIFLSNDQKSNIPFQQSTQPPKDQIFLSNGQKSNIPFQQTKIKYSFPKINPPQKTQIFCQGDGVPSNSGGAGSVDWGDRRGRLRSDWVRRVCSALC